MSSCVLVDVIETNENIVVMEATIMLFVFYSDDFNFEKTKQAVESNSETDKELLCAPLSDVLLFSSSSYEALSRSAFGCLLHMGEPISYS